MLIGEKQHKNLLRFACDPGGEREQGELGQEKISSCRGVVLGQALGLQNPCTELGGRCWGVHSDSLSHNGCLLLLAGFPVIP